MIITRSAIQEKKLLIKELQNINDDFGTAVDKITTNLQKSLSKKSPEALINHLRLCGDIPENFTHDSTEEKLYSKYTDILLSETYKYLGFKSVVLKERADNADVEAFSDKYSFIADAKVFRLSRTAKNQKDFKIQAMDNWRRNRNYAMVVCPIYQLPTRASQIYQQASSRNVCIFTYSHLVVLIRYAEKHGKQKAQDLLHKIFEIIAYLNSSKDAAYYWMSVNSTMLQKNKIIQDFWKEEKLATVEAIAWAKHFALNYLDSEREKIMRMTHEEALSELIKVHKINNKIKVIDSLNSKRFLEISSEFK